MTQQMPEIKQAFTVNGQTFDTKAEAMDFLRRPKILEALETVTGGNEELSNWLMDNQDSVTSAFDHGSIRRVTKADKKKLAKACERVVELFEAGDVALKFLAEAAADLPSTFRYPTVSRLTPEEKALAAKNTLLAASDNNEDLAKWVIDNEEAVIAAYDAGKVKREPSEKAQKALADYRAKKAAEKAEAAEAAEAAAE